ncbi:MAG: DUF5615 family PIN-like protein [Verrucomicrobiales bacterium]
MWLTNLRFIVDAQLPPALAKLLADHGHTAEHVVDVGLRDADDSQIWNYALENEAAIVTKDEDFPQSEFSDCGTNRLSVVLLAARTLSQSASALRMSCTSMTSMGPSVVRLIIFRSMEELL